MVYENILQEIESRQELLCALNDYGVSQKTGW